MIYDSMERLTQYRGLNANLDKLIDYVLTHDFDSLVPGKNDVDGEAAWVSNNVAELKAESDLYERHMAYIDLQIPIDEGEIIHIRPVEGLEWAPSDDETRFTHGGPGTALDMAPGAFAIFFPGDAHNCGISKAGQARVRKLVGKARV